MIKIFIFIFNIFSYFLKLLLYTIKKISFFIKRLFLYILVSFFPVIYSQNIVLLNKITSDFKIIKTANLFDLLLSFYILGKSHIIMLKLHIFNWLRMQPYERKSLIFLFFI